MPLGEIQKQTVAVSGVSVVFIFVCHQPEKILKKMYTISNMRARAQASDNPSSKKPYEDYLLSGKSALCAECDGQMEMSNCSRWR